MSPDLAGSAPAGSAVESDGSVLLPHDAIIDALQSFCGAKRSGIMFIITADNHVAQFMLRSGEIVGLSHRLLRGPDALPAMRAFAAGRYRFVEEPVDRTDRGLPPTLDLLAFLIPEDSTPANPPQSTSPTPSTRQALESLRSVIEPELTEFLGPMAEVSRSTLRRSPPWAHPNSSPTWSRPLRRRLATRPKKPISKSGFSPTSRV